MAFRRCHYSVRTDLYDAVEGDNASTIDSHWNELENILKHSTQILKKQTLMHTTYIFQRKQKYFF